MKPGATAIASKVSIKLDFIDTLAAVHAIDAVRAKSWIINIGLQKFKGDVDESD